MAKEVKPKSPEPTNKMLAVKAIKLGYPKGLANKANKETLNAMLKAGKYPNEAFPREDGSFGEPQPNPKPTQGNPEAEAKAAAEAPDSLPEPDGDGGEAGPAEGEIVVPGMDLTIPAVGRRCTVVYGGPVIKGVTCPFGFTVEDVQLTDEEMKKYGVGKGVTYHCNKPHQFGTSYTYRIVYPSTN